MAAEPQNINGENKNLEAAREKSHLTRQRTDSRTGRGSLPHKKRGQKTMEQMPQSTKWKNMEGTIPLATK